MGLIREIQGVNATMNRQERARRERERLKILQENYKNEILTDLWAEFSALFEHYDTETAYNTAILQKNNIIDKIYNIILKIKYEVNGKKYYKYKQFDILQDLKDNFFKILEKVKKEYTIQEAANNAFLLDELKNDLTNYMNLDKNKYLMSLALKSHDNINNIIISITSDKQKQAFLFDNYYKILNNVLKLYQGDIINAKSKIKEKKEKEKEATKKKFAHWLLFNYILSDISKSLPKPHNKKKKY